MALTNRDVTTGVARLSYEHVFQPYARSANDTPKYSVTILVPKSDTNTKAAIDAAKDAAKATEKAAKEAAEVTKDAVKDAENAVKDAADALTK